ncbi:MAG: class IV adenylate cyclase [Terriglobia bacterium]
MKEIEVKLKVDDVPRMRRQLQEDGFELVRDRVFEDNWLFDFPSRALRESSSLLRLRKSGDHFIITFKDPPERNLRYKVREEIQTEVAGGETVRCIFRKLGLEETFRYQKYRTEFRVTGDSRGHVLLDETPIGTFLELEGAPDWIDQVAARLGFSSRDYLLKSYATLFLESCPGQEIQEHGMVFDPALADPKTIRIG